MARKKEIKINPQWVRNKHGKITRVALDAKTYNAIIKRILDYEKEVKQDREARKKEKARKKSKPA